MDAVLIHKESLGDDGPAFIDDRSQFLIDVWKQFLQFLLFQQVHLIRLFGLTVEVTLAHESNLLCEELGSDGVQLK